MLNGKLFYEVLIDFKQVYSELLDFVCDEKQVSENSSYFALNLNLTEKAKLKMIY